VLAELAAESAAAAGDQQQPQPIEAWITFTCRDGGTDGLTDHGDLFEDCVKAVMGSEQVIGVGFNCTEPYLAPLLLSTAREHSRAGAGAGARTGAGTDAGVKYIVCYPNSGEVYDMRGSAATMACENNGLFEPYIYIYTNAIILPRQARDRHRESITQKKTLPFSSAGRDLWLAEAGRRGSCRTGGAC
jgi:hypothetical protein